MCNDEDLLDTVVMKSRNFCGGLTWSIRRGGGGVHDDKRALPALHDALDASSLHNGIGTTRIVINLQLANRVFGNCSTYARENGIFARI